jgi:transcription elongation factor Elf1
MLIMTEETETISPPYFEEFRCLNCNWYLGAVIEHEGRTVLRLSLPGIKMLVFKAEIRCEICGETREFHSAPMSAVRLKKWMEERNRR